MRSALKAPVFAVLAVTLAATGCRSMREQGDSFLGSGLTEDTTTCAATRDEFTDSVDLANVKEKAGQVLLDFLGNYATSVLGDSLASALAENFSETLDETQTVVRQDTENIQDVSEQLSRLYDCRKMEAAAINVDLRSKRIDRATAESRMAQIRLLMSEDTETARAALEG